MLYATVNHKLLVCLEGGLPSEFDPQGEPYVRALIAGLDLGIPRYPTRGLMVIPCTML